MRVVGHWNRLPRQPLEEVSIVSECVLCPTAIYLKLNWIIGTGAGELCYVLARICQHGPLAAIPLL